MTSTFGERLSFLRKEYNLTQREIGEIFNVSTSAIGSYERNEREPTYKHLLSFAEYFNVSLDYLMGRTDERLTIEQYISKDSFEISHLFEKYNILVNGKELSDKDKQRLKDVCDILFFSNINI